MTNHKAILNPRQLLVFSALPCGSTPPGQTMHSIAVSDSTYYFCIDAFDNHGSKSIVQSWDDPLTHQATDLYNRFRQQYPIALPNLCMACQSAKHGAR